MMSADIARLSLLAQIVICVSYTMFNNNNNIGTISKFARFSRVAHTGIILTQREQLDFKQEEAPLVSSSSKT